jgi:hypothetical protein
MYATQAPPGLAGFSLKKVFKKVEQKLRPIGKVAAVVGTAMYAPQMLPTAISLVSKPKAEPLPALEPLPVPVTASSTVPLQPPVLATQQQAQMLPQLLPQPQSFAPQSYAPQAAPAGEDQTKKLLIYGGLGLGAFGLVALLLRRR